MSFEKIHKDTRTHEISLEFNSEDLCDTKDLLDKLLTLAMTIKPGEKKVVTAKLFKATLRAKKNYTAKSFLVEHQKLFDAIQARTDIKEN